MQKITILIGLPGSGKSTYIKNNSEFKGAFICDDYHKSGKRISKKFEGSLYYNDLINALSNGKNAVISDIIYCKKQALNEIVKDLLLTLKSMRIKARIDYIYFENNPKECKANIIHRNKRVERELEFVDKISPKYEIPKNSKVIRVYEAKD